MRRRDEMITWSNDSELFELMRRELYSAVLGDILDKMQYFHQFLPSRLQPLEMDMVLAGRAMTVLEADRLKSCQRGRIRL